MPIGIFVMLVFLIKKQVIICFTDNNDDKLISKLLWFVG